MSSIPLYIVVNSHLSDSLIEIGFNPELASKRIRFVKVLTNMFSDLSQRIEEDELNRIWKEKIIYTLVVLSSAGLIAYLYNK